MDNLEQQWKRRKKLTELSISNEAKETVELTANQADAAYQQAVADRSTAQLNLDRTVVRASVNGYVTNLTLVVGQYAAVGIPVMALIDSDSYRITGFFEETKMPAIKPGEKAAVSRGNFVFAGRSKGQLRGAGIVNGIARSEHRVSFSMSRR
jgi:multidrug resistance efflux pump